MSSSGSAEARAWDPIVARDDDRAPIRPRALVWLVAVVVVLPIAAATLRAATGGWVPEGDDAWIARRVHQVASTDPPLIGQESTADDQLTADGLNHPGPLGYYLLAVPYGASGWSPVGLAIGAGVLAALAAWSAVLAAWRAAGDAGALAAGVAVGAVALRISQEWLVRPNNTTAIALPLVAVALGLWAYLRGDRLGLGLVALWGTFVLQSSLAGLPVGSVLVVAALAVAGWRRRRRGRWALTRAGAVVAAVVVLAWVPPLLETFLSWPGNGVAIGEYLGAAAGVADRPTSSGGTLGLGAAAASVVAFLTGVPGLDGRTLDVQVVWLVPADELDVAGALGAAALAVGVVAWGWWRRHAALLALVAVAALSLAVGTVALSRRPTATLATQTYFAVWVQATVAVAWTALALAVIDVASVVVDRLRSRPPRGVGEPIPFGLGLSVLAGVAVVAALAATTTTLDRRPAHRVAALAGQLRDELPEGTYEVAAEGTLAWTSVAKGVGQELIVVGHDIRFTEFGGMVDEPRRRAEPGLDRLVVVTEGDPPTSGALVARTVDRDADVRIYLVDGDTSPLCTELGEELAPSAALAARGLQETAGEARAVVDALNVGLVAQRLPEGARREALETFDELRPAAREVLAAADDATPLSRVPLDPAFVAAHRALVVAYGQECEG